MRIVVISSTQIKSALIGFLLLIAFLVTAPSLPRWVRSWKGVQKGVTLEGRSMEGLYAREVNKIVQELAQRVNRAPRNAGVFPETGEIIPEADGLAVDIPGTIDAVMTARPRSHLHLLTYRVTAALDQSFYKPVYEGNSSKNQVSLTFNVAWGEEEIPRILEILHETRTHATFFFVGTWVEKFPELVQQIAKEGHEIANHGLYHGHPSQMGREALVKLIEGNHQLLKKTIAKEPVMLFAPPYGEFDQDVLSVAGDLKFKTILWTVDTVDWKRPAPEVICERVRSKIKPGSIVLMHPTAPTSAALPAIIKDLKSKGLKPVPVSVLVKK